MSIGANQLPSKFVYSKIINGTGLSSFVDKCFPEDGALEGLHGFVGAGSYITYAFRNTDPTPTKTSASQLDTVTLLVNCFVAPDIRFERLRTYAGAIRDALDRTTDANDLTSYYVQSCSFVDITTGFNEKVKPSGVYFATLEFDIRISKS